METNINQKDIKGTFKAKNGRTYIFLINGEVWEEDDGGNLTQVDLSKKDNIKNIRENIGKGYTDVER